MSLLIACREKSCIAPCYCPPNMARLQLPCRPTLPACPRPVRCRKLSQAAPAPAGTRPQRLPAGTNLRVSKRGFVRGMQLTNLVI